MRTKKVQKSRHVSDMRDPSVMSLVFYVGNAVGKGADGHVSDMRDPSVIYIGNTVGIRADGHVSDMHATIRR